MGGIPCYNRVYISQEGDWENQKGEWVSRQYLRPEEVNTLAQMQGGGHGRDAVVLGVRGLTRVEELDNAIMREVRGHYQATLGNRIGVIMNVLQHMTPNGTPYYDERVEEPILTVILLKSDNGTHIRKVNGSPDNTSGQKL